MLWWASRFDHTRKKPRFFEARTIEIIPGLKIRLAHGPGYNQNKSLRRFWHHRALAYAFFKEGRASDKPNLNFSSLPTPELSEKAVLVGKRINVAVLVDVRDLWPDMYLTLAPRALGPSIKFAVSSEFHCCRRLLSNAIGIVPISKAYLKWALDKANREPRESDGVFSMGSNQWKDSSLERLIEERVKDLSCRYDLATSKLILTFAVPFTSSFDIKTVIEPARVIEQ